VLKNVAVMGVVVVVLAAISPYILITMAAKLKRIIVVTKRTFNTAEYLNLLLVCLAFEFLQEKLTTDVQVFIEIF